MAYSIIDGRLHRQDVQGGRWELVDVSEQQRAMEVLAKAMKTPKSKEGAVAV